MISPIGKRSKNKGFHQTGFTFIELVLVTIIILVLVGLATPIFRDPVQGIQLKTSTQNLIQLMRYLQAKAIAERRLCRINFDFEKMSFWPTVEDETSPGEFRRIKGKWARTVKLPEGIFIAKQPEEDAFISFYPDGSSDKAALEVSDQKGRGFAVSVQRTIGYVQVEK